MRRVPYAVPFAPSSASRIPLSTAAALLAASMVAPSLEAQTGRDTVTQRIEPVRVTGTRSPAVAGGAAAVVILLDSLPVPTQPSPSLEQVLRQTPFVLVRQNSRGEIELSVRGSDSRQAALVVDGLPLTLGWDHRSDPSLIPTTGVERLTLVRGLATVLGGPNTLGGMIVLETNGPLARNAPLAPTLRLGTGIDQYAGRVATATGSVPMSVGSGTLRVRGGFTYRQRDGFALSRNDGSGDGTTGGAADPGSLRDAGLRTNTDLRQLDGFTAIRYDAGKGLYVGFTGAANSAQRGVAPELHVTAPRFWRYPQASRQLGVITAGTGPQSTPFGFGSIEVSGGINAGTVEIETFANREYASLATRELGDEHTSVVRAVATHTLPANATLRLATTLGSVRYIETLDAQKDTATVSRYVQRLASTGAEIEVPVLSRLLLSGGVVHDQASTPETAGRTSLGTLGFTGWRVGATAAVTDMLRLHASASQRPRFPALRELYSGALNRFDPNPELRPEQLLGFEVGATYDDTAARGALQFQAIAFNHRLDDAVVRVTLPNRLFRRINRDEIRTTGTELLAAWSPASLHGVSFNADLLAQRVRVFDQTLDAGAPNERRAEHQPELRGTGAVTIPLPAGIRASAMARYTGRQFCQHPDLGRLVELRAQTVGDAGLSRAWRVGRGLFQRIATSIAMDNVTNATVYDQCGLPQPGRTLRVGVEVR